jgi:hypothetical protein
VPAVRDNTAGLMDWASVCRSHVATDCCLSHAEPDRSYETSQIGSLGHNPAHGFLRFESERPERGRGSNPSASAL